MRKLFLAALLAACMTVPAHSAQIMAEIDFYETDGVTAPPVRLSTIIDFAEPLTPLPIPGLTQFEGTVSSLTLDGHSFAKPTAARFSRVYDVIYLWFIEEAYGPGVDYAAGTIDFTAGMELADEWTGMASIIDGKTTVYRGAKIVSLSVDDAIWGAPMPALPEPSTWAMMIGGFALVGVGMRRRNCRVAFV